MVSQVTGMADLRELAYRPTGAVAETYPRAYGTAEPSAGATLVSGRAQVTAIALKANTVFQNVTIVTGSTPAVTPTHQWLALTDASLNQLTVTGDLTTGAMPASTAIQYALGSSYQVTADGLYYLVLCVVAATMPTVEGDTGVSAGVSGLAPILQGTSDTGLTTPPANGHTYTALTAGSQGVYAYLS